MEDSSLKDVWVEFNDEYFRGKIIEQCNNEARVHVTTLGITIKVSIDRLHFGNNEMNYGEVPDLTSLRHVNEPEILHVLSERAYMDIPYTFLGPILLSVNPLRNIPEALPIGAQHKPGDHLIPHPYTVGELAFHQLCFNSNTLQLGNHSLGTTQSIIIAGESGSGKTEVSNRVLSHLISRSSVSALETDSIKKLLLSTSPILESFGNATTLRNHNSSRFGKFTKLHYVFNPTNKSPILEYASVSPYLLERSRLSSHGIGERTFHIFYQLLAGLNPETRAKIKLVGDQSSYRYTSPLNEKPTEEETPENLRMDEEHFSALNDAFSALGLMEFRDSIFQVLSCILHIGNILIIEKETEQGMVAFVASHSSLDIAAELLGLSNTDLHVLICERTVLVKGEEPYSVRKPLHDAVESRDALSKNLYSNLFDWIVQKINTRLSFNNDLHEQSTTIGVLDIFGFETFQRNDFEQILINFANEALQKSFEQQIFVAEASLYRQEGFLVETIPVTSSAGDHCLQLLSGKSGILRILEAQCEAPNPTDAKFLQTLHGQCSSHPRYLRPHPKDARRTFIVSHYAADVVYTIGNFVAKNLDRLPKDAHSILKRSTVILVKELSSMSSVKTSAKKTKGIVSKFTLQIGNLIEDLETTQCSFVRCIKPNSSMSRDHGEGKWVESSYVQDQLQCLGIPQTAMVLKSGGFPTRLDYTKLLQSFMANLPKSIVKTCNKLVDVATSKSCNKMDCDRRKGAKFIRALLQAYSIPTDGYRYGHTKIFFAAGSLHKVDILLDEMNSADALARSLATLKRLKIYCARIALRSCFYKVIAVNKFKRMLQEIRISKEIQLKQRLLVKSNAAARIQSMHRSMYAFHHYQNLLYAAIFIQRLWKNYVVILKFKDQLRLLREAKAEKKLHDSEQETLQAEKRLLEQQMEILRRYLPSACQQEEPPMNGGNSQNSSFSLNSAQSFMNNKSFRTSSRRSMRRVNSSFKILNDLVQMEPMPNEEMAQYDSEQDIAENTPLTACNKSPALPLRRKRLSGEMHVPKQILSVERSPPRPPPKSANVLKRQSICAVQSLQNQVLKGLRTSLEHGDFKDTNVDLLKKLYFNEQEYIDTLDVINQYYYQPLMSAVEDQVDLNSACTVKSAAIVEKREIDIIFSNLKQLVYLHEELIRYMEKEMRNKDISPAERAIRFSGSLQKALPYIKTIYAVYAREHSKSIRLLVRCKTDQPKFAKFLGSVSDFKGHPCYSTDLKDLLAKPMNRISRYNEFLADLVYTCTNPSSKAYLFLKQLKSEFDSVTEEFEHGKRLAAQEIRHFQIASQLFVPPKIVGSEVDRFQVLAPGRIYNNEWYISATIHSSDINMKIEKAADKRKDYMFFVFSDILIVAKRVGTGKYQTKAWIDLAKLMVDTQHIGTPNGSAMSGKTTVYPLTMVFKHKSCSSDNSLLKKLPKGRKKISSWEITKKMTMWFKTPEERDRIFNYVVETQRLLATKRVSLQKIQKERAGNELFDVVPTRRTSVIVA